MPMKITTRKIRKSAATTKWRPDIAPERIVNSLMNGPNGGEPVIARKPARKSAPESGTRRSAPLTLSIDLLPYARWMFPAERKRTTFVRALLTTCRSAPTTRDAADADAEDEDPHVLDARVREHPLEVALPGHERRRDRHRDEAEAEEELARERPLAGRLHDAVDPQEREERAVRHPAREEGPDDPGGLAVGVRLPRVHRREAHLRPVADDEEDEARPQPGPGQAAAVLEERREEEALVPRGAVQRGVRHEERAEKRERDPDRPDHEVLPRRLERARVVVEVDEHGRRERRALDGDPDDREVLRERDRRRHREERQEADAEDEVRPLLPDPQVADAVDARRA